MKKIILFIAIVFITLSTQAQDYNVVITTTNGATIALSTNDVSNISFNNGQFVVTGTNIEKLANEQYRIDSIAFVLNHLTYENRYRIKDLTVLVDSLNFEIGAIKEKIDMINVGSLDGILEKRISFLENSISFLEDRVKALEAKATEQNSKKH